MKILILNGSPKGERGVTARYMDFLQIICNEHQYTTINVSTMIHATKNENQKFEEIIHAVNQHDIIVWAFPLYFAHVHGNYKRFIELVFEQEKFEAFKNKHAIIFATSINFFDNCAIEYMHAICDDLHMNVAGKYSAYMMDLLEKEKRENIKTFFDLTFQSINNKQSNPVLYAPLQKTQNIFMHENSVKQKITTQLKTVIITDALEQEKNIMEMIQQAKNNFTQEPEIINLRHIKINGGCLGCINCGFDNTCVYENKDEYISMFRSKIDTADIIIFAGTIHDRYFSSIWKTFHDRSFFTTHKPKYTNKQIAFIVSGNLSQNSLLRESIQIQSEWGLCNLVGIVSDESSQENIRNSINTLMNKSVQAGEKKYISPRTFLAIGGIKIFRDEFYEHLGVIFRADYKYYKKHKLDDYPHKHFISHIGARFLNALLVLISPIRKEVQKNLSKGMVMQHKLIIEKLKK